MNRLSLCLIVGMFAGAIALSGCCAPCAGPIGPGCGVSCNQCGGVGAGLPYAYGPLDAIRNARSRLVCGAGCGEPYLGEWISTPPDSADPCCGSQFVGGATKCHPYCWERGTLVRGLYGKRLCSPDAAAAPCGGAIGCGCSTCLGARVRARRAARCACASCASAPVTYASEQIISEQIISDPIVSDCGCGVAGCSAKRPTAGESHTIVAKAQPVAETVTSHSKKVAAARSTTASRKVSR